MFNLNILNFSKIIKLNYIKNNKFYLTYKITKRNLHFHEYQCKELLKENGVNVQRFYLYDKNTSNDECIKQIQSIKFDKITNLRLF